MAKIFIYHACDLNGARLKGRVAAETKSAAAAALKEKDLLIMHLEERRDRAWLNEQLQIFSAVSSRDLAVFCRIFATLASAGVSFVQCLEILQNQTQKPRLKNAILTLQKEVKGGANLAQAMKLQADVFPSLMIGMIEAGEASGALEKILAYLANLFSKEHKLREKMKSALTYPACISFLAITLLFFILTFVLPNFKRLFEANKMELPLLTKLLFEASLLCQKHWLELLSALWIMILMLLLLRRLKSVKEKLDRFLLKLPFWGMLLKKAEVARFSYTLGALLKSGLPLLSALEMAGRIVSNTCLAKTLLTAQKSIREGGSLAAPLQETGIFPELAVQMIGIGESCGEMEAMLEKISEFYEADVEEKVYRLSVLVEPFLILFLGVLVGGIVWAVMLPFFDFSLNLGK